MGSLIEPQYAGPYAAWKDDPSPANSAAMLEALHPTIAGAIQTHVGASDPLIYSKARRMTLEGLRKYDPARGRLQTHLYNHLQGLKRAARKQSSILSVPERVAQGKYHLDEATRQLGDELGREPTDREIADRTGFSFAHMRKVRTYRPAVSEGAMADRETGAEYSGEARALTPARAMWQQLVYDDLDPYHQKIMEHSLGINGRPILPNHEIAARLGRSPGAISQAKARIQALLEREDDLTPF